MSFQSIINSADSIEWDRKRVIGIQYTRSEIARFTEIPTRNPWQLTVTVPAYLPYDQARSLLEDIDRLDRDLSNVISFGANPRLRWLLQYQGALVSSQVSALRVGSFVGQELYLNSVPPIQAGQFYFKNGDFIQIQGYPNPFTVRGYIDTQGQEQTGDVPASALRNSSQLILIMHRNNFITQAFGSNTGIIVGTDVQFRLYCVNSPTYKIKVGGTRTNNGSIINNALIEWSDSFQFYEDVSQN
jgi:hypothetical protein